MDNKIAELKPADIATISEAENKLNQNRDNKVALVAYNTK